MNSNTLSFSVSATSTPRMSPSPSSRAAETMSTPSLITLLATLQRTY
jgi:hypothetical protein